MEEKDIEKIVKERLLKIGITFTQCKKCGKDILFLQTKNGKRMPVNFNLTSHFADCPYANEFRGKESIEVVRYP